MLTAAAAICAMHNLHPALSDEEGRKNCVHRKDSASLWPLWIWVIGNSKVCIDEVLCGGYD